MSVQPARIGKRHIALIAHDDMIQHANPEDVACTDESIRQHPVFLTRRRITTWVVMLCDVAHYVEFLQPDAAVPA